MTAQELSTWTEIVRQALQGYFDLKSHGEPRAVPGAPLKPLVMKLAEERGLIYPPLEFQNKKFSDFLQALPEVVVTQKRSGQDLLVAPAGRLDLFEATAEMKSDLQSIVFRQDVFKAFTKIPTGPDRRFWYSKFEDAFVEGQSDTVDVNLIPVEPSTLQTAIEERHEFTQKLKLDSNTAAELSSTISNNFGAMGTFSAKVKELRLERYWHQFRAERVRRNLQAWASANNIAFNTGWMEPYKPASQDNVSSRETNAFLAGLMHLGPEDAKRILVPLDIVLKVLRRE
jgi:hypothetical protein